MAQVSTALIEAAKQARRINTNAYNKQIHFLLESALMDLGVAGVEIPEKIDPLVSQAAITYFLMHFGKADNFDQLERSYKEQKAQLSMLDGYTDWGVVNDG